MSVPQYNVNSSICCHPLKSEAWLHAMRGSHWQPHLSPLLIHRDSVRPFIWGAKDWEAMSLELFMPSVEKGRPKGTIDLYRSEGHRGLSEGRAHWRTITRGMSLLKEERDFWILRAVSSRNRLFQKGRRSQTWLSGAGRENLWTESEVGACVLRFTNSVVPKCVEHACWQEERGGMRSSPEGRGLRQALGDQQDWT